MAELIRTIMSIFKPRDYGAEAEALSKRIQQSEAALPIGWCGDGVARGELDWLRMKARRQRARRMGSR